MEFKFKTKIAAFSMALLMLLSSTGFAMDVHYCQDELKGFSFFGKAKSCHEKKEIPACHKTNNSCQHMEEDEVNESNQDNCCHNESVVIEKPDLEIAYTQVASVKGIQLDFVVALIAVFVTKSNSHIDIQPFARYKPPLPDKDIPVLFQTFLI